MQLSTVSSLFTRLVLTWLLALGGLHAADLTVSMSHPGSCLQGQIGATYTITVTNSDASPTIGPVTVTGTLPAGLTPTALSGAGWVGSISTNDITATRAEVLAPGASFPSLTLTVNVAANAPSSVTATATVGGGGDVNPANNTASVAATVAVISLPVVTSVSSSNPDGSYKVGSRIDINVTFDSTVTVTGTPTLLLETGSTDRSASYFSGSGTSTLTFRYTVQTGDVSADLDYPSTAAIALNGGTIRGALGAAVVTLPSVGGANSLAGQKALVIDGIAPLAVSIVRADPSPTNAESVRFTITFSEAVSGVDVGDFGRIGFASGGSEVPKGTITGVAQVNPTTYTLIMSGITGDGFLNAFLRDSGTGITDTAGNPLANYVTSPFYRIDRVSPTATIVVADTALRVGETSLVTITCSEAVTGLTTADFIVNNGSLSGLSSSDGGVTWTATFTPGFGLKAPSNFITLDNTGYIDAAGNTGTGTTNSNNYAIDTQRPNGSIIIDIAETVLTIGETVPIVIVFNEPVLGLTLDDFTVPNAVLSGLSSSNGGSVWTATLTPTPGVTDLSNIVTLDLTGVSDAAGNSGIGVTNSINYQIDQVAPTVTSVSVPASATYQAGQNLDFTVNFSETVFVGFNFGTQRVAIAMETGGTVYANYLSGSNTNAVVFRMTVASGQADIDGVALAASIELLGGFIRDPLGNHADLTLNSVADTTGVRVDAVAPVVAGSGIPDQALRPGSAKVLNLPTYFTDIGSTSMTYSVTANTASDKASADISGGKLRLTPLANGITHITIQADDGHGGTVSDTFEVAVGTAKAKTLQLGATGKLNQQNGLFELTVKLTNTTARPLNGFRLNVDCSGYGTAYPGLRLFNATGSKNQAKSYIDYPFPVACNETISMKLRFYSPGRKLPMVFEPKLKVKDLTADQVTGTKGKAVPVQSAQLPNKDIQIEFPSVVGKWYRVRYSEDLIRWRDCLVPIQASTTRTQWIDSGPPFTDVPPSQVTNRYYRVNEISAR